MRGSRSGRKITEWQAIARRGDWNLFTGGVVSSRQVVDSAGILGSKGISSMIEGLWVVQFEGTADSGGGVVVFVRGQVLGGDSGFVYTGTYQSDDNVVSARVLVRNFNPAIGSVFGIKGNYELAVRGTIQGGIIKGTASLVNQQGPGIVVKLTKIAGLTA
jgi:hypothetical protein